MSPTFIFFSLILFAADVKAQTSNTITGTVTDSVGSAVPGATVTNRQSHVSTLSDANGKFQIAATAGQEIEISSLGFSGNIVVIGADKTVNVVLVSTSNALSDVVVVGYGTQLKRQVTGSIASVNIADAKKFSTSDINGMLQGRVTGVEVRSDGQPGAVPSVRLRGFNTFGNASPFYVVDGVPVSGSIRDFSPNDIESITVLKDASAASIYGAAAANGVIIITTKQGRKNTPMHVEYNGYYGWDNVWQYIDVTKRVDYQTLNNESRKNAGLPLFPANDPGNPGYIDSIDTDWQKEGIKTGNRQNHNVSVSGGGEHSTYNLALDYFDNNGTYVGNGPDYTRYTARINSTAEKGIFRFGESFNYTHSHENTLTFRDDILLGGIPPLVVSLVEAIPTMPVYDPNNLNGFGGSNSEFNGANSMNAIGVNSVLTNWVDVDRTFGNVFGEVQLLKKNGNNLRFKTSISYDKTQTRNYTWQPAFYFGKFYSNDVARLYDGSNVYTNFAIENTFNYDLYRGKHTLNVLAGQSYRENSWVTRESSGAGYTTPYYPVIDQAQTRSSRGSEYTATLSSFFGRANYSYADKYLLSATLRRDGSSRFGAANRYGYFPAASAGWKISSEDFWNVSPSAISLLKIRGSYGKLGNDNIGDYLYQATINSGIVYPFSVSGQPVRVVGGLQTNVVDKDIKWEEKALTNIGIDAAFLNNHIDLTADYYISKASDILVGVPIPATVGSINLSPTVNAATLKNTGIEVAISYHKTSGKFTFDITGNLTTVKNEVLALGGNDEPIYGTGARTEVGHEVGEQYGFVYEGIFQSQDEIDDHATQFGAVLAPGDVKYKDISGPEGKPDGVVDEAYDRTYLGSSIPKYNYGLNFSAAYRNFDFTLFMSGSAKFLIDSRMYRDIHHSAGALNYSTDMLNRWTPDNTNTTIPRLNDADVNNFKDSDRPGWLQDGTFLRINNLVLGYTLPAHTIKYVTKARVYINAQNLYTFQGYEGYNPDFTSGVFNPGFDFGSYPKPRVIMVGVQIGF
ncbi:MAG TPA: TonB-dependent receptor [Parafilimonas sp.]|nr:TonB-dependent receptor [Parafilimonas sp.]